MLKPTLAWALVLGLPAVRGLSAQEVRGVARGPLDANFLKADALLRRMAAACGAGLAHRIEGRAVLRNYTHPKRAGDFQETQVAVRLESDPGMRTLACELRPLDSEDGAERLAVRDFHLWQRKAEDKVYHPAASGSGLADQLRGPTLAKLDPAFVVASLAAHRENLQMLSSGRRTATLVFAAGSELWRIHMDTRTALITSIETAVANPIYGDMTERVTYGAYATRHGVAVPSEVVLEGGGWLTLTLQVSACQPDATVPRPGPGPEEWAFPTVADSDVTFRELAPRLFAIELKATNSRVFVAEFSDHLFVIEGAYTSENGDVLARRIAERFPSKPIRYHAFSHIHGQYAGSARSFLARGATLITTPTGAEVLRGMVAARRRYRPDALASRRTPAKVEVVPTQRAFEDATNALTVFNVASDHTDDYDVFYFPRRRILLSGDLLMHRGPDQPLRGRSRKLCDTVAKLGIPVSTFYPSWPLEGFGVSPEVSWEAFSRACSLPEPPR